VPIYHSKAQYSTAINCCWPSRAQLNLASGTSGTHDQIVFRATTIYASENCSSSSSRNGMIFLCRQHNCCILIRTNWLSAELLLTLVCTVLFSSAPNGTNDNNLFSDVSGSLHTLIQQKSYRTRTSIKHGPHRKHCVKQLLYCLICTRIPCLGNVFAKSIRLFSTSRVYRVCITHGRDLRSVPFWWC
jgi:hypothetical protein